MRIVAVADTHNFEDDLDVPGGDVFIHAGDFCRRGTLAEMALAAEWVHALPHRHKVVIAGNHDWCFQRTPAKARELLGDRVHYLEDSGVTLEGVTFWGSPWQPEFMNWAFNLPRGEPLAEKWALIPEGVDVLVTHGPPHEYGDRTYDGRHEGCRELLKAVDRVCPALHVFGHIHEDGGAWSRGETTIANVTTSMGRRSPTVFDIDVEERSVDLVSVPPGRG